MTELLLETELTPRQRMYAETVLQSGERLLRVVEDVLDYSRLDTGAMRIEVTDFELRTLLRKANAPFLALADDKGLFLHYSVGHDVPDALRGDADHLRQVLSNFLRNAVVRTGDGEVYMRVVLVEESDAGATIRFEVIDTAPGISPRLRNELFSQPSIPLGESIGTGMELPISRRLADLMGGEIGVESEPDEGNILFFELHLEKQPERSELSLAPRFDLRGLRALIVGDEPTSHELLREQAISWGMRADLADEGPEALALLRNASAGDEPHDLVILDADLRGASALELARVIKADPATSDAQLVLLSSLAQDELDERTEDAGIAVVLTKPVPQARLYECLASITSSRPGAPTPPVADAEEEPATPRLGEVPGEPRGHLLVVEDDPVNQIVAARMLESLGYTFDVAKDGREAVEALSLKPYAMVLMDVQMPIMDGYEATQEIRAREGQVGHTPIIAMTANAMQGDRERTLEAGMDDYLPKPVKRADLEKILALWTSQTEEAPDLVRATEPPASPEDTLDRAVLENLLELQLEGEPKILGELVEALLDDTLHRLTDLRKAISRGDAQAVKETAHALKGSSGNMGAKRMAQVCEDLEETGRSGDLTPAPEQLAVLEDEFGRARAALETELSRG